MKPALLEVTQRIRERSATLRSAYLARVQAAIDRPRGADRMGCANVAHAFAALPASDKFKVVAERAPNIGVVTAYNDMLSAHAPFQHYPDIIKAEARKRADRKGRAATDNHADPLDHVGRSCGGRREGPAARHGARPAQHPPRGPAPRAG